MKKVNHNSDVEEYFLPTRNGKANLYRLNRIEGKPDLLPVLFIHGFNSNDKIWFSHKKQGTFYQGFAEKALDDGYDVWILGLSKSKMADLRELAEDDLLSAIQTIFAVTNKKVKIVAHSMSGVLIRYLTHPIYFKSFDLDIIETMVCEIVTLSTPHFGFTVKQKTKNRVILLFERFEKWISKKESNRLYSGFFQFMSHSELFVSLNSNLYFNPNIKWTNAVAEHDFFNHNSSILPIENLERINQKFFNVNHFKPPFSESIIWLLKKLSIKSKKMDFYTTPPIYWSPDVYEWIFTS